MNTTTKIEGKTNMNIKRDKKQHRQKHDKKQKAKHEYLNSL